MSAAKDTGKAAGAGGLFVGACTACCAPLIAPWLVAIFAAGSGGFALAGQAGIAAAIALAGGSYVWWRRLSQPRKATIAARAGCCMAERCNTQ